MNTQEFEQEELNSEAVHAEETNDSPTNAIEISGDNKGIDKFRDKVSLPAIPETLNINGVELNIAQLTTAVAEVKTMKIDGLGDEEGYNKAVEKQKELSKLRTGSESWRKEVMKPVLKFQKDLKKKIDEAGDLCSEGEKHLEEILAPIKNAREIAIQKAEEEKDKLQQTRIEEMIALGGVLTGTGTINFPYDGALFVLTANLRTMVDEAYNLVKDEIQASYDVEQKRIKDEEDAKLKETEELREKVAKLNEKRTAIRRKELKFEDFVLQEDGIYTKEGFESITEDQIVTLEDEEWDLLITPVAIEPEPTPEPAIQEIRHVNTNSYDPFVGIADDFADEDATEEVEQEAEPQPEVEPESVMTRSLVFSTAKPSVSFELGNGFSMLIFPTEYEGIVAQGETADAVVSQGSVNNQLNFFLVKNTGA